TQEATKLANNAASIIKAEQINTQGFNAVLLNNKVSAELLSQELIKEGISAANAETIAEQATTKVVENPAVATNLEFQIALQISLEILGMQAVTAQKIAQNFITSIVTNALTPSPLLTPVFEKALPPPQLAEQIHDHVFGALRPAVGPDQAKIIANNAVT